MSIDRVATSRGVYLRQPQETTKKQTYTVTVTPRFYPEGVEGAESLATQQSRVDFQMKMNLRLGPSNFALPRPPPSGDRHISHPDHLLLMNNGRTFSIEVDPTDLESGLYTSNLVGYDAECPDKGSLFSLPITITKPMSLPENEPSPNLGQVRLRRLLRLLRLL